MNANIIENYFAKFLREVFPSVGKESDNARSLKVSFFSGAMAAVISVAEILDDEQLSDAATAELLAGIYEEIYHFPIREFSQKHDLN